MSIAHLDLAFATAHGLPPGRARVRVQPEDFVVEEILALPATDAGSHLCLQIRKRDQNTRWVAQLLAAAVGVDESAIGYCGLKDRRALTTQWFSVPVAGGDLPGLVLPACEILERRRQARKLRRGMHSGNRFRLRLRDVEGSRADFECRLRAIATGVPNYFGEQRFGIAGGNLREFARGVAQRRHRWHGRDGLYLSAARAYLFNLVVAERVHGQCWRHPLAGETEPTGPLWGRGRNPAPPALAALEERVLAPWAAWREGLEHGGLRQERRPLLLSPVDLRWQWAGADLSLEFELPVGAYATAVLRELVAPSAPPQAPGDAVL